MVFSYLKFWVFKVSIFIFVRNSNSNGCSAVLFFVRCCVFGSNLNLYFETLSLNKILLLAIWNCILGAWLNKYVFDKVFNFYCCCLVIQIHIFLWNTYIFIYPVLALTLLFINKPNPCPWGPPTISAGFKIEIWRTWVLKILPN